MHETHLLKNIFQYLDKEEKSSAKKIRKIYISLSEFGGISSQHFRAHYREESAGTRWENLKVELHKVPYGPELEITKLDFVNTDTHG
ncbi:MAG: hypothetical protein FJZ13_04505 [Candidatus Omnitrophica bacterium]|nr:hypothetical protein [Candidatus Omnitrophota bacterium]